MDSKGQLYLIGTTESKDFRTENPVQKDFGGGKHDAFVAKLTEDGQKFVYSTYLGGTGDDKGQDLAVDSKGEVQSTVTTTNSEAAMNSINNAPPDPVTDANASAVGGTGNGSLIVTVGDVAPDIAVKKDAVPTSVPASSGGSVEYSVVVTNNTPEAVTLASLSDTDNFGDNNTCTTVSQRLEAKGTNGDTYSCSFERLLPPGDPAKPHDNTVTATAKNDKDIEDTATDKATVRFTSQQP